MAASLGMDTAKLKQTHCTGCLDYNNPFDMRPYDPQAKKTLYI
jgi:hypothetical protein